MKLTKYHYRVLVIKDGLNDIIHKLAYFHKDSVTSWKKIKKGCDKKGGIKKDCDNGKRLRQKRRDSHR